MNFTIDFLANELPTVSLLCILVFVLFIYIGAATGVASVLRLLEYGIRFSGAVLATALYVFVRFFWPYFKAVLRFWREEVQIAFYAIKDLLSMSLHGGGKGNWIAIVITELMFLVCSFVIIIGLSVTVIVSMASAPIFILISASYSTIVKMIKRSCE